MFGTTSRQRRRVLHAAESLYTVTMDKGGIRQDCGLDVHVKLSELPVRIPSQKLNCRPSTMDKWQVYR